MKHLFTFITIVTVSVALPAGASAFSKNDVTEKYPALSQRVCSARYDSEVQAVGKLIDKTKAKKKLEEMKALRKDQERELRNTFDVLEEKAVGDDERVVVQTKADHVMKAFATKSAKMSTLQSSTIISDKEVDMIVATTILEGDTIESACPITLSNAKQIRKSNTDKLKKLAEDKKRNYLVQVKQIQAEFLETLGETLPEIDAIIQ